MEISWFDKTENSIGAIGARLSIDAASVRGLLGDTLALLVQNTATAIAGLAISFVACWQLALILVCIIPTRPDVKGDVVFSNVSFRYPTRPDVDIFRDLCLKIESGKTEALVGESGSGKSTVISLLQRFYDPESGKIMVDGVEIQKLKVKWLRQQMGLVSQEPVLFNETIRANNSYGKEGNATEAEIINAAELANAHEFISGLQQGYSTVVGERGIQLSGGQKQRVAIARAMIKGPKIVLLDEATSALDAESEKVVQDALDRVMVDRTTVVVAHRLSTIIGADVIAVVKDGVIPEKGKHEELINIKGGIYASLVTLHTRTAS